MIFNFVYKYFWKGTHLTVPYTAWYRYRASVFATTTELFPKSSDFAIPTPTPPRSLAPSSRMLPPPAISVTRSNPASICSGPSLAPSATRPPAYTHVSLTSAMAQFTRRAARNRNSLQTHVGGGSYHSSAPAMMNGTPIAQPLASVFSQPGEDDSYDAYEAQHKANAESLRKARSRFGDRDDSSVRYWDQDSHCGSIKEKEEEVPFEDN